MSKPTKSGGKQSTGPGGIPPISPPVQEKDLRYERPSDHRSAQELIMDAKARRYLDVTRGANQASDALDALGNFAEALSIGKKAKNPTLEDRYQQWVKLRQGADAYTEAVPGKGALATKQDAAKQLAKSPTTYKNKSRKGPVQK